MNETGEENERFLKSSQPGVESLRLSRREFLARLGKGSAAIALTANVSIAMRPSSVRAESQPAKSADELIYVSATTLAKAIREKHVSSEEVVNAYLRRIAAVNPQLNAVVQLTAETALQQAREADAALARGELKRPLHGVPFTVKDTIETAGVICTSGTKGRASFVPARDAAAVARLRAAGAILLGKTNVSELGLGFETDNLVYGRTNNPYNVSCIPGGSSGGEAAIIAAAASPLGLGSQDMGLSAHCCGIVAMKPTPKRVPMTGHFPFPTAPITSHQRAIGGMLWQIGPMAKFVEDLSLTLPILVGEDGLDPNVVTMPLGDPQRVELRNLRVAFYTDNGIASPTAETAATVRAAAKALSEAGLTVEEERPKSLEQSYDLSLRAFVAEPTALWVSTLLQEAGTNEPHSWTQWFLEKARPNKRSQGDFIALRNNFNVLRSSLLSFQEKYDVIICPVSDSPAPMHGAILNDEKLRASSYVVTYAFMGWPVAVVRGGTSPEGLPIGVQIVAREWREDVALAVAQQIETALGGWKPPQI